MNFEELWKTLPVPGEFDSMDVCDQARWRGVVEAAFDAGRGITLGLAADARWYCVDANGIATLCANKADAEFEAADNMKVFPGNAPYRVTQLVDITAVVAERERCAKVCDAFVVNAERESGSEAAGWLYQAASHMRGLDET